MRLAFGFQILDLKNDFLRLDACFKRVFLFHRPPHHHFHDFRHGHALQALRPDFRPVAQHGEAVADFKDFLQAMRHVDNRDAFGLQALDDGEQRLYFFRGQRRGRLV